MPAFGRLGMLSRAEIGDVAEYVLPALRPGRTTRRPPSAVPALFAENCAACHGERGEGSQELGAPNLTDQIWLYGGEPGRDRAADPQSQAGRDAGLDRAARRPRPSRSSPSTSTRSAAASEAPGAVTTTGLHERAPEPAAAAVPVEDARSFKEEKKVRLYAERIKIYPKAIAGRFRRIKWAALVLLLGIYYVVPWLRWDRGPGAPDQAVLIDMPGRPRLLLLDRDLAAGGLLPHRPA